MRKNLVISVIICILINGIGYAQCPDATDLHKQFIYTRDKSSLTEKEKRQQYFHYLETIRICFSNVDSTRIYILRTLADSYVNDGDDSNAVRYMNLAISEMRANKIYNRLQDEHLLYWYYWLSEYYKPLDNIALRMRSIDSCIDIAIRLRKTTDPACLRSLYARTEYFFDIGDYQRCIEDATACERLSKEYMQENPAPALSHFAESMAYSVLGWNVAALQELKDFKQVEQLLTNKLVEYRKPGFQNYLALIYAQSAETQIMQGHFDGAMDYLNKALAIYQKEKKYFDCKQTLNTIGNDIYFRQLKQYPAALNTFFKALQYGNRETDREKKDAFESLNIMNNIANVYVQEKKYDSAFVYFKRAFDQIGQGTDETTILRSSSDVIRSYKKIHYLVSLLSDKADAYFRRYHETGDSNDLKEAIRVYGITDKILDRINRTQFDLKSKLFWRNDTRSLYDHAVTACYEQHNTADAFYFFERSRAVLLNDQILEQRMSENGDIAQRAEVGKRLARIERDISGQNIDSPGYASLKTEEFVKKEQLINLEKLIKEKHPLYYQRILDTSNITLNETKQKVIAGSKSLVELFYGDSVVFTMIITPTDTRIMKISKPAFDSAAGTFLRLVSDPELMNSNYPLFQSVSRQLYSMIFGNRDLLTERVIISPDGKYFPFEALISGMSGKSPVYFIRDHAVTYAYSARYLLNDFENKYGKADGDFLGMAPVTFKSGIHLATLEQSDLSLGKISRNFTRAREFVGQSATRNNFLQYFSKYSIIQLYTHATDTSSRGEPVIYFSDSALYLSDLFNEEMPVTRLIVLSACKTAMGKEFRGEGVFSFNREFAALGVPAAITNLWSIDNQVTYEITEKFYSYLEKGMPTDLALQKAKKDFIQTTSGEKRLPVYWAATILAGLPEELQVERLHSLWFILIAVLIGSGIVTWFIKSRRR